MTVWLFAAQQISGRDEQYCYHKMPFRKIMTYYHMWLWEKGIKCVPADEGLEELMNL